MSAAILLAVQWLLASAGSVAAGLLAWLLLSGAARLWPALRTRRNVWLAAQCMVAAAALLPFAPRTLHFAPQIEVATQQADVATVDAVAQAGLAPLPAWPANTDDADADAGGADDHANADASAPGLHALPLAAALWLLTYIAGLAWAIIKQLRARRMWRQLLATTHRVTARELQADDSFTPAQREAIHQRGLSVMRTDAAVSPMLIGALRPILLLPTRLKTLTGEQQQMIVAHELQHWRARDPLCLAIAAILQTVFWFNPVLRRMAQQMEWALELQCDQQVLAGRPQHQRKQYAASLLQQWRAPVGVAAFNGATIGATIGARIRHMQQGSLPALSAAAAWATGAALSAILAASIMLQPALAFSVPAPATPASVAPSAPTPETWRAPLDQLRVTSFFGVRRSLPRTPHRGIDFGAAKGTPVRATASGIVIAAGPIAENDGKYGNTIIMDHGAQRSLYAHLNSVNVQPGQRVQAGALIGAVGETGLATGPHLHLEVRQQGQIIDPATLLTNLDDHATARALKVRRQQRPLKE